MSFRPLPLGTQEGSMASQERGESKRSLSGLREGQSGRDISVGWVQGDEKGTNGGLEGSS